MNKRKLIAEKQKKIAKERIDILFSKADESSSKKLADRYVAMARRIAMRVNLRLPSRLKRKFCRHCGCYFIPGKNLRVRTRDGKLVYYCLECKKFWRMPCKH
ncbi:MAG: ribonuclease P [Candidatus Woesearchaeota archaeon]